MKNKLTSLALSVAMFAAMAATPAAARTVAAPPAQAPQPAKCAFTYTTKSGATLRTGDAANGITIQPGTTICVPPSPAATRAALRIMTTKALGNATYTSDLIPNGTVTLKNGKYSEAAAPDSASQVIVQMTRYTAYGTLNGVPSAAVILASNGGGSGTFYTLHIMQVKDGLPTDVANALLGDRIRMKSNVIKNNQVVVTFIGPDEDDPACCPTQLTIEKYALQNGQLVLADSTPPATPTTKPADAPALVGTTWNWTAFKDTAEKNDIAVKTPQNYTLLLNPDGTANIKADCNQVTATYVLSGSQLSFKLGASTLALCPEGSLDQQYLSYLSNVVTYVMDGEKLVLNLKADAGNMEFGAQAMAGAKPVPPAKPETPAKPVPPAKPETPAKPEAAAPALVGSTWNWMAFKDTAEKNNVVVNMPENYTLLLNPDGTANIKADCNQVSATYVLTGSQLSFKLGASTRAFCGENSLDQKYLSYLSNVVTYVMDGAKLVLNLKADAGNMEFGSQAMAGAKPVPPAKPEAAAAPALVGTTWNWMAFKDTAGKNNVEVKTPQNYTLLLNPDGTANIKADCNQVMASYVLSGTQLTIKLGASTLAFCGENSLDQKYLMYLSSVATYVMDGAKLVLNLKADAGNMEFGAQAAAAAKPPAADKPTAGAPALVGTTWQWQSLKGSKGNTIVTTKTPQNYTLLLQPGGNASIRADCNQVLGAYTITGNQLSIKLGPSTMAFCGEGSLDLQYLGLLGKVATYAVDGSTLTLNLTGDAGSMIFGAQTK